MTFCPNLTNKKIKQEFEELIKIAGGEDGAYYLWDKNNGYSLDCYPDGQPSLLYNQVYASTGNREDALAAVGNHLADESQIFFQTKSPAEAKYHYGRDISSTREERESELREYYYKAYDSEAQIQDLRNSIKIQKDRLKKIFYDSTSENDESVKNEKVEKYKKQIKDSKNPFIKNVKSTRLSNGGILVYVETYTAEELYDQKIKDYIKNLSDDDLFSQLQEFERVELGAEMYHINPKRIPELKMQIGKKNPTLTEQEIDEALNFLTELENSQEDNAYVECCLKWLKNGTIILPRDNEKVRQAFDLARQHNIDIQKHKSPISIVLHAVSDTRSIQKKQDPVDLSKIKEFRFNKKVNVKGRDVFIYDVDNTDEGQLAVCKLLHDTGLYDERTGKPISFSPWCLSTYNVSSEGTITPTASAKNYWQRYNQANRQIAICDGVPVAFNSSSYDDQEWWDFYDGRNNYFNGYHNIEDVDLDSPKEIYNEKINDEISSEDGRNIKLGRFEYYYTNSGKLCRLTCNGLFITQEYISIYTSWVSSRSGKRSPFEETNPEDRFEVSLYDDGDFKIILYPTIGQRSLSVIINGFYDSINDLIEYRIRVSGVSNESISLRHSNFNEIDKLAKQILRKLPKEDRFDGTLISYSNVYNQLGKMARQLRDTIDFSEIQKQIDLIDNAVPYRSSPGTQSAPSEAETTILSNAASQQINQPFESVSRRYTDQQEYNISSEDQSEYNISEDTASNISKQIEKDEIGKKYEEYIKEPMNAELTEKLHKILKKYKFDILEGSMSEAFGDDILGAFDVLQKIIYLENPENRNAITDPEEFSHAFIKMMGAVYHREENREKYPETALYSKLRDDIMTTSFYEETYEQYKDLKNYKYKNGAINKAMIAEEALGKALAVALLEQQEYLSEIDKSFVKRVKNWFNRVLRWFFDKIGKNNIHSLEEDLNEIAYNILTGGYKKYLDKIDIKKWKNVGIRDTLRKDAEENGSFGINLMEFMTTIGGYVSGSVALRAQGRVYRTEIESLHDFDISFPLSVHRLHTHADFTARQWTSEELISFLESDQVTSEILNKIKEKYPSFDYVSAFASSDENIIINGIICDDQSLIDKFKSLQGNFNKRLKQFTKQEQKKIHLVDLFFNQDNEVQKNSFEFSYENPINFVSAPVIFKHKLSFSRAKDLMDYQLWAPYYRTYRDVTSSIMNQKGSIQQQEVENSEITDESIFEQQSVTEQEKNVFVDGQVRHYLGESLESIEKVAIEAEHEWGEKKQQEILGETQLQLAKAFGLRQQKDGSWSTSNPNDPVAKLRVEFVESLAEPGSIDFNHHSTAAHSLILIGLNNGDASTFNHELAHYYIRTFWNSKVVQNALNMVYKKSMGDYKTDPKARIAVEEALVDYITAQTVENAYLTELESDNGFHRFWQAFNKMLYEVFNIKTKTARNAILNQIVRSFVVNEQLSENARDQKFVMHDGIMHQTEYQKRKTRVESQFKYDQTSRNMLESTVDNITRAVQNKEKSYRTQSIDQSNPTYGSAEQAAFNQESVRLVKESIKRIEASRAAKDDTAELMEKVQLFHTFLNRADEETQKVLSMMYNARSNERYSKVMYNIDTTGVEHYEDASGSPITPANATPETKERAYTFDDLQYAKTDIISFFSPIIKNIVRICDDADTYGISSAQARSILDFVNTTGLVQRIDKIESMYNEARKQKCFEWIDDTVDSRDELNDDFKNRLKINMHKWLDEQMDFGDISVFETYIGMGTMSKSPIIRAIQDEISDMQFEKDQIVYKKMLSLNEQLQKAKREMGITYNILPFNVQKLLLQLDKYGLPTGNLISAFNVGQYKRDLETFKNEKLFGKNGLESKLRKVKDASGNPVCVGENGKPWKLMLDQFGNPIIPNNPDCNKLEKEYLKDVELFKSDKQIRRFTSEYYIDRIDALSITTLKALSDIEDQIDDIKNAVTINGKFRPDLLTDEQQQKLKDLHDQRNQLSSPYELDGSLKTPGSDEYKIAQELKEWHLQCNERIFYMPDVAAFNESFNNAKDKNKFMRRFAKYQINPEIWDYVMMHALNYNPYDPDYIELKRLKYDRAKLLAPYKGFEIGQIDFGALYDDSRSTIKNFKIFEELKKLDEKISDLSDTLRERYKGSGNKYDTEAGERFVLSEQMIPYNLNPGVTSWNSISQYQAMIDHITARINSDPSIPDVDKQREISKYENLLTYYDAVDGMYVPLSIFSTTTAKQGRKTVMVKGTAAVDSYVVLPGDMFSTVDVSKSSLYGYVNPEYDIAQAKQDGPIYLTDKYKDKRYEKYIASGKHPELAKLLEDVKDLMKTSYEDIPFLGQYDGRAAQIGARTGQILGRKWYNISRLLKNIGEFLRREFEIVETDTDFLQQDDGFSVRPDGTRVQNIPIRFVKRLDNPEYISADVVGSALKFFEMSTNYKIKTKRASKLNTILSELSKTENYMRAQRGGMFKAQQAEVVRGMYDRQMYETKNVNTNNRDYILDEEWKHFDWFRKYVISNPAAWVKRVQKSRAAFQLGMLALNATSGIISFLDPLISMSIDVTTGKYINVEDFFYALGKMSPFQGNIYGNALSLGGVRAHSKAAAAMQKFQLAKSNSEAVSDMDQGKVMRFLSDGLTMKHFTLGDYTINTINVIATMHNYRYYKKKDGTAEFYPKELFIKTVMDDLGCTVKEAREAYDKADTMWASCELSDKGELVGSNTEQGQAISEENWKDVRNRVRSRSSIYNGVVPDIEKSLMQTNVVWSFVTMLRNFFITGVWERFQGYNDFQVASLDNNGNPVDKPAMYQEIKEAKKRQRFYKGGLNMSTRMIENGVDRGAFAWLTHIGPYLKYAFHMITHPAKRSKYSPEHEDYLKEHNLSQTDVYGMQKIFMEFTVFLLLLVGSAISMRVAGDDDNKDNYLIQMWNLLQMRLTIERFTFFSPQTAMDLISSPTAALSDWKRKAKIFDLMYDAVGLSEHDLHEEVKQGRYAGEERWKYNLFNALSSFGVNNWYADMPEFAGGGGAKSVREKSNFYKGLIKGVPMGQLVVPKKESEEHTQSSRRSSSSRGGSRGRRR